MDLAVEIIKVFLRSGLSVTVLFLVSRIEGPKQISQLTFYDYIVGISIGSIAAAMAIDRDIPFWYSIIAMVIYAVFTIFISILTSKSIICRRLLTGKPSIMIYKGKIIKSSLKDNHYDINDLLLQCRIKGYFNIDDIECAVMETNGEISILPKSDKRPLNPNDMSIKPKAEMIQYNLIIDGKVLMRNLKAYGKDTMWLKNQLKAQKVNKESEVLLCVGNDDDTISVFLQDEALPHNDFFM